ncbi:MAG: MFS transporter [Proteobacteria bacterium]|nr:MFS transporter [Pseudomonadota bacterium]
MKRWTVFYGWWVVVACSSAMLFTSGIIHFGFTAVFEPIAREFGWGYAQISLAASLRGLEIGLLAPVTGLLVDRWGPRRLIFGGAIVTGCGLILLSRINSLGMFYGAFILIAVGMSTCSHTVMMAAVSNWFRKRAGIAIGVMASGVALGGLMIPVITVLIDLLDWRRAMVILGLGAWIIVIPLSLVVRHRPEQYGYLPDGEIGSAEVNPGRVGEAQTAEVNIQPGKALKSRPFWQLASALTCYAFVINAVVTHIMPYLSSVGVGRMSSSLVAGALPVASIGGRIGFGWLGDKHNKRLASAAGFLLIGLGLLLFDYAARDGSWTLLLFLALFGTGWGANVTLRATLLREYFGRERFGTIHGFIIGIMMMGNIAGAPVAGWAFDRWGSYQGVWFAFSGVAIAAMVIMATLPKVDHTVKPLEKS